MSVETLFSCWLLPSFQSLGQMIQDKFVIRMLLFYNFISILVILIDCDVLVIFLTQFCILFQGQNLNTCDKTDDSVCEFITFFSEPCKGLLKIYVYIQHTWISCVCKIFFLSPETSIHIRVPWLQKKTLIFLQWTSPSAPSFKTWLNEMLLVPEIEQIRKNNRALLRKFGNHLNIFYKINETLMYI